MSDDMLLDDLQRLQRMIYKFEKRINDVADDVKHIIDGQGDQAKVVDDMADGYQDMRDRLAYLEGRMTGNADSKSVVINNEGSSAHSASTSGEGADVNQAVNLDQSKNT